MKLTIKELLNHFAEVPNNQAVGEMLEAFSESDKPLLTSVGLKRLQKATIRTMKDEEVKRRIDDDFEKRKDFYKAHVTKTTVYTSYNYEVCGDPEYAEICELIKVLEQRKKELEEEMRNHYKSFMNAYQTLSASEVSTRTKVIESFPKLNLIPSGELVEIRVPEVVTVRGFKYFLK